MKKRKKAQVPNSYYCALCRNKQGDAYASQEDTQGSSKELLLARHMVKLLWF